MMARHAWIAWVLAGCGSHPPTALVQPCADAVVEADLQRTISLVHERALMQDHEGAAALFDARGQFALAWAALKHARARSDTVDELGYGLAQLLDSPRNAAAMGQRARMRAQARHSAEALAKRLEALYTAVIEARRCAS